MDENTLNATRDLEEKLDKVLRPIVGTPGTISGSIIKNKEVVIDISRLLNILNLTEKYMSK